jgi:hypothetical protein
MQCLNLTDAYFDKEQKHKSRISFAARGVEPHDNFHHAVSPPRERCMRCCIPFGAIVALVLSAQAQATWKPEYASSPPEVQAWYQNAELTEAAKIRFPFKKCCDHADVVRTRFTVNKTDGGDEWFYLDGESWKRIPPDIIHWGETAPGGQPTLFVYSGKETCFFPGDSGI